MHIVQNDDCHQRPPPARVLYLLREQFPQFGDFGTPLPPNLERILQLLRIRLGYLPTAVAQRRLMGCNFVFLNILNIYGGKGGTAESQSEFESVLSDTLAQIEVALCMPFKAVGADKESLRET